MGKLSGKIAVVTGAASGIGRASALLFAHEGATVVVADCNRAGGEDTAGAINAAGATATCVTVDVTQAESVRAMIDATVTHFGRLDVLFNNAGIGGVHAPLAECSDVRDGCRI